MAHPLKSVESFTFFIESCYVEAGFRWNLIELKILECFKKSMKKVSSCQKRLVIFWGNEDLERKKRIFGEVVV